MIASVEAAHTIERALDACSRSCGKMDHEIIVVDASRDRSAELAQAHASGQVLRHPPGTVVPQLWGEGIRRSTGRWVALSTGHCIVSDSWARALVAELEAGADAVGAGLVPAASVRALDYALFFLRYGGFLDQTRGVPRPVHDVPGDNAAYPGDALRDFAERAPHGFWELEYHHILRESGGTIRAVPEATAAFGHSFPFTTIMRHRFDHGRQFGAVRVAKNGVPRLRIVLPAPLVPFVLLFRNARGLQGFRGLRRAFARGALPFLILGTAWAAGEATGALFGAPEHLMPS